MADLHKDLHALRAQYERIEVPAQLDRRLSEAMGRVGRGSVAVLWGRRFGISVLAAALALTVAVNVSASAADTLAKLPVIGAFTQLVTFRDYSKEQNGLEAKIETPHVTGLGDSALEQALNEQFDQYGDALIRQYEADVSRLGEGHMSVTSGYDVAVDSARQLTVAIHTEITQASSMQINRYYTVDKQTGKLVELRDLFRPGADYVSAISKEITEQMQARMKADENAVYFLGDEADGFEAISPDQNFYVTEGGILVIAFDKYDVAPGYMGAVSFEIPARALEGIRAEGSLLDQR